MRGRHTLVGSAVVVLALAVASAQEKPDFAGRWVLVSPAKRRSKHTVTRTPRRSQRRTGPKATATEWCTSWTAPRVVTCSSRMGVTV